MPWVTVLSTPISSSLPVRAYMPNWYPENCSRADARCSQAQSMPKWMQELLSWAFIILVEVRYCLWIMVGLALTYLLTNFPEMKIGAVCCLLPWWVS